MQITNSVGAGGINVANDVQFVQALLNAWREARGLEVLDLDGLAGQKTIGAIKDFQRLELGWGEGSIDGLISPGKSTITALVYLIQPLVEDFSAFTAMASLLSYEPAQTEPQPEEDPGLDCQFLIALVQTAFNEI